MAMQKGPAHGDMIRRVAISNTHAIDVFRHAAVKHFIQKSNVCIQLKLLRLNSPKKDSFELLADAGWATAKCARGSCIIETVNQILLTAFVAHMKLDCPWCCGLQICKGEKERKITP